MDDILAAARWTVLANLPEVTPSLLAKLYRQYNDSATVFSELPVSLPGIESILKTGMQDSVDITAEKFVRYTGDGIRPIPIESPQYPASLLHLRVPPAVIFISGELTPTDYRAIAIVGTRTASQHGLQTAKAIAKRAVELGFCVVSGLARGIDTAAHQSTLHHRGRTIAILGNGLQNIYPPENKRLAGRITRRGALISELPPEKKVSRKALLARDRLQAAMSLAVVAVQTHTGCGTLTTARYAISCRRPLFAINWKEPPFDIGLARLRDIGAKIIDEDNLDEVFKAAEKSKPSNLFEKT